MAEVASSTSPEFLLGEDCLLQMGHKSFCYILVGGLKSLIQLSNRMESLQRDLPQRSQMKDSLASLS